MNALYYPYSSGGYGIDLKDLKDTFKTLNNDNFRTWSVENYGHSSRKLYALLKTMQHEGYRYVYALSVEDRVWNIENRDIGSDIVFVPLLSDEEDHRGYITIAIKELKSIIRFMARGSSDAKLSNLRFTVTECGDIDFRRDDDLLL